MQTRARARSLPMKELGTFEYGGFAVSLSASVDASFFFVGSDGGLTGPGSHVTVYEDISSACAEFESLVVHAMQRVLPSTALEALHD